MKKRFLVLVDYSDFSINLIAFAAEWAEEQNAQLVFIHQASTQAPAFTEADSKRSFKHSIFEEEKAKLHTFVKKQLPKVNNATYYVSDELLKISVSSFLKEPFEHLIFAGIKGTGILKQIFIGSEVVKLVDAVDETVVALPKIAVKLPISSVHVAVHPDYPINIAAFKRLLKTINNPQLKLNFIHFEKSATVNPKTNRYFKDLEELFAAEYLVDFNTYTGQKSAQELKNIMQNNINDFVVIQKGSRYLSDQIFRKYFINELIYEGSIPLVVLP